MLSSSSSSSLKPFDVRFVFCAKSERALGIGFKTLNIFLREKEREKRETTQQIGDDDDVQVVPSSSALRW